MGKKAKPLVIAALAIAGAMALPLRPEASPGVWHNVALAFRIELNVCMRNAQM